MATTRRIISRYSGQCRKCGNPYGSGDEIYWTKGQRNQIHVHCPTDEITPKERDTSDGEIPTFSEDWYELKEAFLQIVSGNEKKVFSLPGNQSGAKTILMSTWQGMESWVGATIADMKLWIANGYKTEAFHDLAAAITPVKRRRIKFSEEGEFQYDLMRSGADYPFLEWEKRESKPGLKFDIDMTFQAGVSAETVAAYSRWVAKTLYSLETEGYDLEVAIRYDSEMIGPGVPATGIRIVVKKENEATDFTQWSALFSPSAWRQLGFTALVQACDHFGYVADSGLGYGLNRNGGGWKVEWDSENRSMRIRCNWYPSEFPAEDMDRQVRDALTDAR